MRAGRATWVGLQLAMLALHALAQDVICLECHDDIARKVTSHKSCTGCHARLNPREMPHSPTGKSARQMMADGPGMCVSCHKKDLFQGKVAHAPVEDGKCLACHEPHASNHIALLKIDPATLCIDCHPDISKGPHVIAGITRSGHPLGIDRKEMQDPLRPGKKFYCGGCHEPHRSEFPKLTRFAKGMESCQKCHKK